MSLTQELKKRKACKCGSFTHSRTSYKKCKLNTKNGVGVVSDVDTPGGQSLMAATLTVVSQQLKDVLARTYMGGQPPKVVHVSSNNGLDLFVLFKEIVRRFGCKEQRLRLRCMESFSAALGNRKKIWKIGNGDVSFSKCWPLILPKEVEDHIFSFVYGRGNVKTWIAGPWLQFPKTATGAAFSVRRQSFTMTIERIHVSRNDIIDQLIKWEHCRDPESPSFWDDDENYPPQLKTSGMYTAFRAFGKVLRNARLGLKMRPPFTLLDTDCSYVFRAYGANSYNKLKINADACLSDITDFFDANPLHANARHSFEVLDVAVHNQSERRQIQVLPTTTLRSIYICRANPIPYHISALRLFCEGDYRRLGVCIQITAHSPHRVTQTKLYLVNLSPRVVAKAPSARPGAKSFGQVEAAFASTNVWSANQKPPMSQTE